VVEAQPLDADVASHMSTGASGSCDERRDRAGIGQKGWKARSTNRSRSRRGIGSTTSKGTPRHCSWSVHRHLSLRASGDEQKKKAQKGCTCWSYVRWGEYDGIARLIIGLLLHNASCSWAVADLTRGSGTQHDASAGRSQTRFQARLVAMLSRKGMSGTLVFGYRRI
jgi:hypothetical protein